MILDAIIALFAPLFGIVAEGVLLAVVPLINLVAVCIEAVIGIFVSGFSLGRIERNKREPKSKAVKIGGVVMLVMILGLLTALIVMPKVMNREVTLVAEDGHSLPFAAVIIHTGDGKRHERTDRAGNIVISRFGTKSIEVKDPRYVGKVWEKSEIESELVVGRTVLGSSLDILADKLLKPSDK